MISALDNCNIIKTKTENGNNAYCWSNDIEESIVQYYFQCVLDNNMNYREMQEKYKILLHKAENTEYFPYVLKLCLQTRDIIDGKGLYQLSYVMLEVIVIYYIENKISKNIFLNIFKNMVKEVKIENKLYHPYGSWKDLKLFLNYIYNSNYINFDIVLYIIKLIIDEIYIPQMIEDRKNMSINKSISLCGKWLPRESSKEFKWLSRIIAIKYYNYVYRINAKKNIKYSCYRKLITEFNKYLDTTQIHMTSKNWDKIEFNKVTAQTIFKNKESFLNKNEIHEKHRNICKNNFLNYIVQQKENNKSLKGKNIMPHYLVKEILKNNQIDNNEIDIINLQWNGLLESLSKNENHFMKNCIPCMISHHLCIVFHMIHCIHP